MNTCPRLSHLTTTQPITSPRATWRLFWEVHLAGEGRWPFLKWLLRTGRQGTNFWPAEIWWTLLCCPSTPRSLLSQRCRGWSAWPSVRRHGKQWSGWTWRHPAQPQPSALLQPVAPASSTQSSWMSQTLTWTLLWTFTWSTGESNDTTQVLASNKLVISHHAQDTSLNRADCQLRPPKNNSILPLTASFQVPKWASCCNTMRSYINNRQLPTVKIDSWVKSRTTEFYFDILSPLHWWDVDVAVIPRD